MQALSTSDDEEVEDLCKSGVLPDGSVGRFLPAGYFQIANGESFFFDLFYISTPSGVETFLKWYNCSSDPDGACKSFRVTEVVSTKLIGPNQAQMSSVLDVGNSILEREEFIVTATNYGWTMECVAHSRTDGNAESLSKSSSMCSVWGLASKRAIAFLEDPDDTSELCGPFEAPPEVLAKCKASSAEPCGDSISECQVNFTPISPHGTDIACSDICLKNPLAKGCSTCVEGHEACGVACCPTGNGAHRCIDNKCMMPAVQVGGHTQTGPANGAGAIETVFVCDEHLIEEACAALSNDERKCEGDVISCGCACTSGNYSGG